MKRQMLQFAVAGAIGFVVDASVLYVCLWLGLGYFAGRAVSFLCAVFVTWQVNRRLAFSNEAGRSIWREWFQYLAAMSFGGVVNYAAYSLVILLVPASPVVPLLAVGVGSIAAMSVNFLSAKFWVFKAR